MSDTERFMELKKDELKQLADYYAVDDSGNKDDIVASLLDNGVTYAQYYDDFNVGETEQDEQAVEKVVGESSPAQTEQTTDDTEEKAAELDEAASNKILLKMTRANRSYEAYGYRFTREHPYQLVPEGLVSRFKAIGGFSEASLEEAAEYYDE